MIISHSRKFILVRTPKTASVSMINALKEYEDVLHRDHPVLKDLDFDYSDYKTAVFVRNPWQREVSLYYYYRRIGMDSSAAAGTPRMMACNNNFPDWLRWRAGNVKRRIFRRSQARYTKNVQKVFKVEDLPGAFDLLCDHFGVPRRELGRANVTTHLEGRQDNHYVHEWMNELIWDIDGATIERFGYENPEIA